MLTVYKKPPGIRERVNWYVAYWRTNVCHLFDTKREAVEYAKLAPDYSDGVVNVDWFYPSENPRLAISRCYLYVEHRKSVNAEAERLLNGEITNVKKVR